MKRVYNQNAQVAEALPSPELRQASAGEINRIVAVAAAVVADEGSVMNAPLASSSKRSWISRASRV